MNLREGTTLQQGKYIIEKKLGQGGFGITYLAEQVDLKRKVVIKEFFMKDFCIRDEDTTGVQVSKGTGKETFDVYLKKFVKEARTIASLDNPHIIRIIETFEENNTAYYVMDYLPGGSLAKRIPKDGLEDKIAEGYIRRLVEALEYLHGKDILHLDIKPDNILFKGETMVLVDFGLAKHYDKNTGGETSNTPQGVSKGYAPLEQYDMDGVKVFTPATDIYALGATFYHLLVGKRPPVASEVQKGLPPFQKSFPKRITDTIQKAMMPAKEDRPQSVAEFLEYLDREDVMEEEDTEVTLTPDQVDTGWKPENDKQVGTGKTDESVKEAVKVNSDASVNHGGSALQEIPDKSVASKPAEDSGSTIKHLDVSNETPAWMRFLKSKGKYIMYATITVVIAYLVLDFNFKFVKGVKLYDEGISYIQGDKDGWDLDKAIAKLSEAAGLGHTEAMRKLGNIYYLEEYGIEEYKKAVEWYTKAAEQGNAEAQFYLGVCYQNGYGVPQDYKKAVEWYTKAAEQGNAVAQYNLGVCYYNGQGVQQNYKKAVEWYSKAAEQGDADAQYNLGVCYYNGQGVQQNYKKAAEWYSKAAEQGYENARKALERIKELSK